MPLVERFITIEKGTITITGNTLMLQRSTPPLQGGPFVTIDTSLQVPGSPPGTTNNWTLNSATAVLNIPPGSTVEYAELTWTSVLVGTGGSPDVSANKDDPVLFTTPSLTTLNISPQFTQAFTTIYLRSADVTSIIQSEGAGNYTVGRVAGVTGFQNPANAIGWFLSVVLINDTLPPRLMQINVGYEPVATTQVDFTLTGFATPPSGPVTGKIFLCVERGSPGLREIVSVGPDTGSLTTLTRTGIPTDEIFLGIISNDSPGTIDTSGTFGNNNNIPNPPTAVPNARFHIDTTGLDISSTLLNSQTQIVTRSQGLDPNSFFMYDVYNIQIDVLAAILRVNKFVDKDVAQLGDTLSYTIVISNIGNTSAENVVLTDIVPPGTALVSDSFTQDNILIPNADPSLGVQLGTIPADSITTIRFETLIISQEEAPYINSALIEYEYEPTTGTIISDSAESNEVTTDILDLILLKSADVETVNLGDVITYTVVIRNEGSLTANDVVFIDPIPTGTTFIPGTFTVNGSIDLTADPTTGVFLGNISPDESIIVSYQVRFTTQLCCLPLTNIASINFTFQSTSSEAPESGSSESNSVIIKPAIRNFKQLSVDSTLTIPSEKPDVEAILNVTIVPELLNTRIINTLQTVSEEGQILTGAKLIIEGMLNEIIEYVADESEQSIHVSEHSRPFVAFIMIPKGFDTGVDVNIRYTVEDSFYRLLDPRRIFVSSTILVTVIPQQQEL